MQKRAQAEDRYNDRSAEQALQGSRDASNLMMAKETAAMCTCRSHSTRMLP
jgi:hypothetical protein